MDKKLAKKHTILNMAKISFFVFNSNLKFQKEVFCLFGQPVYFEGKNSVAFWEPEIFQYILPPFRMNMFNNG